MELLCLDRYAHASDGRSISPCDPILHVYFEVNRVHECYETRSFEHKYRRTRSRTEGREAESCRSTSPEMASYESAYCDKIKEVMTENRRGKIWQELRVQQPI